MSEEKQIALPLTYPLAIRYTTEHVVLVNAPSADEARLWFLAQIEGKGDSVKLLGITPVDQAEESRGSHEKLEDVKPTPRRVNKPAPPGGTPGTPVVPKYTKTKAVA